LAPNIAPNASVSVSTLMVKPRWRKTRRSTIGCFSVSSQARKNRKLTAATTDAVLVIESVPPLDPAAVRMGRVALRFDLPVIEGRDGPQAPGMDPDRPPRLV